MSEALRPNKRLKKLLQDYTFGPIGFDFSHHRRLKCGDNCLDSAPKVSTDVLLVLYFWLRDLLGPLSGIASLLMQAATISYFVLAFLFILQIFIYMITMIKSQLGMGIEGVKKSQMQSGRME